MKKRVVVVGGGAAGFFAAITCAQTNKNTEVTILEKSSKLLSKVAVSGGGRCNVTHACYDLKQLSLAYPRGEKQLKSAFSRFMTTDTIKWFEERGVKLKTEEDGRMFPTTDKSETIVNCLLKEAKKANIEIREQVEVKKVTPKFWGGFEVALNNGEELECERIVIACGGNPRVEGMSWIKELGHEVVTPVPSLFTFNIEDEKLTTMQGISVNPVKVKIADSKYEFCGPLLITHWGLSGPAVLKLSSYAARYLSDKDYEFDVQINWMNDKKEDAARLELMNLKAANPSKQINVLFPFALPKRIKDYLFEKSGLTEKMKWGEVSKEDINRFVGNLICDTYSVKGKTPFKEEFVTCGGVGLDDVDFRNMQSKRCKDLFFAGEILDIDGITGGFNFQAAWTTGYLAGTGAAR